MPPLGRIVLIQTCAIAVTILAGIIAGLIAASWIWAIACAVITYVGSQAAVMTWAAWWLLTHRHRPRLDPKIADRIADE